MKFSTLTLILSIMLFAQHKALAELITEEDGFKWEKFSTPGINGEGAKDSNGNVIITPIKGVKIFYSNATFGSSLSVGYFRIQKWNGTELSEGLSDVRGNVILKPKYANAGLSVKMCGTDTLVYCYTTNLQMNSWNVYDLKGKKILETKAAFDFDDNYNFIDFKTKKPLGKSISPSNGSLTSFFIRRPTEIIDTPWGQFYATQKKYGNFGWKLLTLSDGTICGAVDKENKTLVPVSNKCHSIEYEDGIFIGRQDGAKGVAVAYDSIGNALISIADSVSHLNIQNSYIKGIRNDSLLKESTAILYDRQGNLLIPPGNFNNISIGRCYNSNIYDQYIIGTNYNKSPYIVVYDKNLAPLLELKDQIDALVDLKVDSLGIYYTYYVDGKKGVISDKGNIVIPAKKYDIVERVIKNGIGFYKVTVIEERKGNDKEYKYGICALNGEELIAPRYSYITNYNGILELTDFDGKKYKYDGDLATANKCKIFKDGEMYFLCNHNGVKLNNIGYQTIDYNDEKFCYTATIGEFSTYVTLAGTEQCPIINQIFDKAYVLTETNPSKAISLYKYLIDLDKECFYSSLQSQSYNNMGVIYNRQGRKDEAIKNFQRAIELTPTNQIASNNLDELLRPKAEVGEQDNNISGWDIAYNLLGSFIDSYSASNTTSNHNNFGNYSDDNQSTLRNNKKQTTSKNRGNSIAKYNNKRTADRTYNNYVSQLIDMNVWRERNYNDSQRRQIQSSMRSLRTKYGLSKSDWEDWDGSPR